MLMMIDDDILLDKVFEYEAIHGDAIHLALDHADEKRLLRPLANRVLQKLQKRKKVVLLQALYSLSYEESQSLPRSRIFVSSAG